MRRHVRQHVAPSDVSGQSKGPVDYAVSLEPQNGATLIYLTKVHALQTVTPKPFLYGCVTLNASLPENASVILSQ